MCGLPTSTPGGGELLTQWAVGWLLLGVAAFVFVTGFGLRAYTGTAGPDAWASRTLFAGRRSAAGRFVFGPLENRDRAHPVLDGDELDQTVVMPTIIVGAGLCLVGVLLLFLVMLTR